MEFQGPVIETERLRLRVPRIADFEAYAAMGEDVDNMRFIGGAVPRAVAWRKFLQMPGAWLLQGYAMFTVEEKATGRWLGQLGPWQPEGWPGTEVGWAFDRVAQGRGFATEAGHAAIDWAFETLGWDEVIHSIHPDNVPSQALAQRLGSVLRGPGKLPEPFQDEPIEIWVQTRAQWQARKRAGA
jgi:RimJ/RimL family protein N-acetyltransferase